ncbi:MAG: hypothetical protein U9Q72_03280 [Patescibacteria group bacterium]|nr:hypothetical protein [Patescibacteria group bacterium]
MLRKFLKFSSFLLITGTFFWLFAHSSYPLKIQKALNSHVLTGLQEITEKQIPSLAQSKEINYSWQYNNKAYAFQQNLYGSVWDFYNSQPKVLESIGSLPKNWEDDFYGIFFKEVKGDNAITEIVARIEELASQKKLNSDQLIELTVAFVQAIPYDSNKADKILGGMEEPPRYPYEVLYEQQGVCSGKSFLLVSLLRELGYGAVLFEYEEASHMAVGIKCPKEYSTYESGYCYVETTSIDHKIGIVPHLDPGNNTAIAKKELEHFNGSNNSNLKKLENVKMFQKTDGKVYQGIVRTLQMSKEIEVLEDEIFGTRKKLVAMKEDIADDKDDLENLEKKLKKYKKAEDYAKYNDLVPEYNDLAKSVTKAVEKYNEKAELCNQEIDHYNELVRNFQ